MGLSTEMVAPRSWEGREATEFAGADGNVLQLHKDDGCTTLGALKTTELYTFP